MWNTAGANVNIAAGQTVLLDVPPSTTIGVITVFGTLHFANTNMELKTRGILVKSGGVLRMGTADCPISAKVYVTLCGTAVDNSDLGGVLGGKAIGSEQGGSVIMYGATQGPMWTFLNTNAYNGTRQIVLGDAVQWSVGNQIVVASTDFSEVLSSKLKYNTTSPEYRTVTMNTMTGSFPVPEQSENFTIRAISSDKKTLTLDRPLLYTHWGQGYEKAEVGLLTRNIVIRGDGTSDKDNFGGQLIMLGTVVANISGVEFTAMGQQGILKRYPIHFHNQVSYTGRVDSNPFVTNCSIHHNYQRCLTIHESNNVTVYNNVAYHTYGHCFFLEDGAETYNVFEHNLGVYAKPMFPPLLPSDVQPSIFWIANPNNSFVANSASSAFVTYWFVMPEKPVNDLGIALWANVKWMAPRSMGLGPRGFVDNIGHSAYSDALQISNMLDDDQSLPSGVWNAQSNITRFISYKTRHLSVWSPFSAGVFVDNVWLDSGNAQMLMTGSQAIINTTFVGESDNPGLVLKPLYGRSLPSVNGDISYVGGYRSYDNGGVGMTLINCTFVNFTRKAERGLGAGMGAYVNSDNSQFGTYPRGRSYGNKFINALPVYTTEKTMYKSTANGLAYQDLDGRGVGLTGGAWYLGNQSIYGTFPECQGDDRMNGYVCSPLSGGLLQVRVYNSLAPEQSIYNDNTYALLEPNDQNIYAPATGATIFYPLGSKSSSDPNYFSLWNTQILSQKFYGVLLTDNNGRRLSRSPLMRVAPSSSQFGDWVVMALPYPKGTKFQIYLRNYTPGPILQMAGSLNDLTPNNPYFDNEQQHLYVMAAVDNTNTPNNNSYMGYSTSTPSCPLWVCYYQINASCTDCTVKNPTFSVPPMPTVLPYVLRHNSLRADLVSTSSTDKGTLFLQLYPYHYLGVPAFSFQLWHSVYGGMSDLYLSLENQNGERLVDNMIGHSAHVGLQSVSVTVWAQLLQGQVYASIRRVRGNTQVLRGQILLLDNTEPVLIPPAFAADTLSCTPSYNVQYIYNDALQTSPRSVVRNSVNYGNSSQSLCGTSALLINMTGSTQITLNGSACTTDRFIDPKYKSVEFMIKSTASYLNMNKLNLYITGIKSNGTRFQVYVNSTKIANAVINRYQWTMVRVNLADIGGSNISCLELSVARMNGVYYDGFLPILFDNIRFSTQPASTSFFNGLQKIVPAYISTSAALEANSLINSSAAVYSVTVSIILVLINLMI